MNLFYNTYYTASDIYTISLGYRRIQRSLALETGRILDGDRRVQLDCLFVPIDLGPCRGVAVRAISAHLGQAARQMEGVQLCAQGRQKWGIPLLVPAGHYRPP